ncbi:MAG TPA: IPTL-CTERM sorting domain-containing protein [Acidobacteriota bacterium]|nr:IPTL-CTERM sorting domain-containing protein [Acidobacteriota bacterium]
MPVKSSIAMVLLWLAGLTPLIAQPTFSKVFTPDTIGPDSASRLRFDITNGSPVPVENLAFTDILPAGLSIVDPTVLTNTCGGTLTAPDGGDTITLSGGMVAGSGACFIEVDVTGSMAGTFMNVSGDLTSDAGNSGPATDDLTISTDRPLFSKSFSPPSIPFGARSTLTFTIENQTMGFFVGLAFVDDLPTGMEIADPPALTNTCGGTLTATSGTTSISLLNGILAGLSTCEISFDVVARAAGVLINSSGALAARNQINQDRASGFANADLQVITETVGIEKAFTDDPVPPGGTVTLEFTISNRDRDFEAVNVAFSDNLDATLTGLVATGLPQMDVCGPGSLLSGTSSVSLTGGSIPAGDSCTFSVTLQVPAAAVPDEYPNVSSGVSGDLGGVGFMSQGAQDSLFVTGAPVLTKTFLTNPVGAGDTTTIEFTIDNANDASVSSIAFSDNLTAFLSGAMVTSLPASGFCGGGSTLVTAVVTGELFLFMSNGSLPANDSCTFQVDLLIPEGGSGGDFVNTTSNITADLEIIDMPPEPQTGNSASATLTVVGGPLLSKAFTDDPVDAGQTVTLEFTLTHDEFAPADATGITFTDELNAVVAGLAAVGLPQNDICGMGSQISGSSLLTLTGGALAPGASCTFAVTLQVPAGALPGSFLNTTSLVTSTVSGVTTSSAAASDTLIIGGVEFTKTFIGDPVAPGDTVDLEFTITNDTLSDVTGFFFTDSLSSVISGLQVEGALPTEPCGVGSSVSGTTNLIFSGGMVTAGTFCTFSVTLRVPMGADGDFPNVTSFPTFMIGGQAASLEPATDILSVTSELLSISKSFTGDPVPPGGTVTLEFTVTNLSPSSQADSITFTDDLDAALSGLEAVGLPVNDVCGMGSQLSGTSLLTLTGGVLSAGGSCTFDVTLQVPAMVPGGLSFTNTTSSVSGQINGIAVTGPPASDNLLVSLLSLSKQFLSAAVPNGSVTLRFMIENLSSSVAASGLAFTDDLDAVISGLVASGLPANDVCGMGSQISGTSFLTFTGGSLAPLASCTFDVTLQVPGSAVPGSFLNSSSDLFQSGLDVAPSSSDSLIIEPPPTFGKAFSSPVTIIGGTVTLTFTIDNSASSLAATGLNFTDGLPAGLQVALVPNASTTCTGGTLTAVAGSGTISYTGGTVAAGSSCTVQVDVTGVGAGNQNNVSGDLTSSSGNSGPASDSITVNPPPGFTKVFAPDTIPVGTNSTLTFTIDNSASTVDATGLTFSDDLPTNVIVATPPNASTTCTGGTLTAAAASSQISYSGGAVSAGASCTVQVDVTGSTSGMFVNTSGNLTSNLGNSGTASDTLFVNDPPLFSKSFAPDTILVGGISTLTFTLDNSSSTADATGLSFLDNLPAEVEIASPSNASTTCTGGTLTAVAGSTQISYSGGTVGASSVCTLQVDVTGVAGGIGSNVSGDLTSSLGNSGTASDTITVNAPPLFSKSFAPDTIPLETVSTLTFTIENNASVADATGLDFVDDLPADVVVASPANASTTCTGGTLTAVEGSSQISYTGGTVVASATCTVQADVTGNAAGVKNNLSGDLTSSLGNSGTAAASLTVNPPPTFAKSFAPNPIPQGTDTTLTFTIDNSASTAEATGLDFSDDLPAGITVSATPNASTTCTGGTLTASAGSSQITYSGGTVGAGASCTLQVDVTGNDSGMQVNTTGNLTSSLGDSGTASDTLTVNAPTTFTKAFSTPAAVTGQVFTLIFTIDNSTSTAAATGLSFLDNLPMGMTVADPANASTTCTGGTLTAVSGSDQVSYTGGSVAAMAVCTVQVDVTVSGDSGSLSNTTEELTSSLGSSGTATADIQVIPGDVEEIPVLSPWGLVGLAGLLILAAWRRLSRRGAG